MMPYIFRKIKQNILFQGLFAFYLLSVLLPRGVCLFVYQKRSRAIAES